MKKFLMLFVLCGLISGQAWGATYNCQVQDIGLWSFKLSNEYLFVNVADYNHSNGKALVCGHMGTNGCDDGTMVFVTGAHYHENKFYKDARLYKCSSSGANSWDAVGTSALGTSALPQCGSLDGMEAITTIADKSVYVSSDVLKRYARSDYYISDTFCWSEKQEDVAPDPKCPAGSSGEILSQNDCKSGERFECAKDGATNRCLCGKCIANGGERRDDGNRTVGKCHPSVCVSEVCKECCKRPASQTIWDRTAQVCQCVNGGKFQKENDVWVCKVDAGAVVPGDAYVCDAALMAKMDGWRTQCVANADVLRLITELEEYCKGKPDKDVFLRLYDEVADAAKQCVTAAPIDDSAEKLRVSRRKISDAHGILVGMREMFKTSVWKDDEGKFNTSRLVSDSIAGVVLGTVGGVVTSNVVKKNQVEDGFEDIKCTIGGQTVAEWGDQFRVGIQ